MDNSEREDLDALVRSPGWARFVAHVEKEWGTAEHGGGAYFTMAARKASDQTDDATALAYLRQICVAQKQIHGLVGWVYDSLKDATKHDQEFATVGARDFSRRGGL